MLYFDLSFWHSFCFERWTGTPKLRFKNFQLSLEHDESECEFLQFVEDIGKNMYFILSFQMTKVMNEGMTGPKTFFRSTHC